MNAPSAGAAPTAWVEPPDMRPATFADFPAIHALESTLVHESFAPEDRRRLFEDNPAWPRVREHWPVGWVMEDSDGTIVGTVTNVPSAYVYRGEEKICANGLAWAALAEHRGYAPMLMDEYYNQEGADLVLASSVGSDAVDMWRAYGTAVPMGDWSRTAYRVTSRRAFARKTLQRRGVSLAGPLSWPVAAALAVKERFVARALPRTPDDVEVAESRGFDDRFDAFWDELREQNHDKLLAVRDRATLEWHYRLLLNSAEQPLRSATLEKSRLSVFTAIRNGRMRAYCVVKWYVRPSDVRCARIVDYQTVDTAVDLLPGLLRAAEARCVDQGFDVLEYTCLDIPKMRSFYEFAPFRWTKRAWTYYFRTTDPALASELADPAVWDPSEYDGDTTFT